MAKNEKNSKKEDSIEYDPLEELNEIDDNFTIETEKDFFNDIELSNIDDIPEYDSESGKIIEGSEPSSKKPKVVKEKFSLMDEIEQVEFNNVNKKDNVKSQKTLASNEKPQKSDKSKSSKFDISSKLGLNKDDNQSKPKKQVHTFRDNKTLDDDTKIIDNVKVDSEGVPLLNQFDTDNLLPKITIHRISFSKLITIVIGIIVTLIGILQAMNDVVRISDHVSYGEHESFAMGLIFLGIIIIVLAFYKELMKITGLNNLSEMMDDIESPSKPQSKNKRNRK